MAVSWGLIGTYHTRGSCEDETFEGLWRRGVTWHVSRGVVSHCYTTISYILLQIGRPTHVLSLNVFFLCMIQDWHVFFWQKDCVCVCVHEAGETFAFVFLYINMLVDFQESHPWSFAEGLCMFGLARWWVHYIQAGVWKGGINRAGEECSVFFLSSIIWFLSKSESCLPQSSPKKIFMDGCFVWGAGPGPTPSKWACTVYFPYSRQPKMRLFVIQIQRIMAGRTDGWDNGKGSTS